MGSSDALIEYNLTMVKKLLAFVLLFWVLPTLLHASTPRDPYQYFFEQNLLTVVDNSSMTVQSLLPLELWKESLDG